jgi:hypothetical protein
MLNKYKVAEKGRKESIAFLGKSIAQEAVSI